jgi:hypothetical protein
LDQAIDAGERKEPVELRRPAHDDQATSAAAHPAVRFEDELSAADVDEVELAEVEEGVAGGGRHAPQSLVEPRDRREVQLAGERHAPVRAPTMKLCNGLGPEPALG